MSHFTVAVFTEVGGKSVDELLAPFDEALEVPTYVRYTKEQLIANGRESIETYKTTHYADFIKDPEEYKKKLYRRYGCTDYTNANNLSERDRKQLDEHIVYLEEEFPKRFSWTDEEVYKHEIRYYEPHEIDSNGGVLSTCNPNGYWDWWTIGGRAEGYIKERKPLAIKNSDRNGYVNIKPENYIDNVNSARVKNIDFSPDQSTIDERTRFWEVLIEGTEPREDESGYKFYNPEYFANRYGTKENYVNLESSWYTWAVVLPDGSWHQKGEMGWFGISGETHDEAIEWVKNYKARFLDTADPNWILTIVDCHI
jgi:hypothetical protein